MSVTNLSVIYSRNLKVVAVSVANNDNHNSYILRYDMHKPNAYNKYSENKKTTSDYFCTPINISL